MNHQELLNYLLDHEEYWTSLRANRWAKVPAFNALRAVVRLHAEEVDANGYGACKECSRIAYYNVAYPCQTIQDIHAGLEKRERES